VILHKQTIEAVISFEWDLTFDPLARQCGNNNRMKDIDSIPVFLFVTQLLPLIVSQIKRVAGDCSPATQWKRKPPLIPLNQPALLADALDALWDANRGGWGAFVAVGLRHCRYRGADKSHLQHAITAAAMNILRLDDWFNDIKPAETRISHFARLAS
jgi:hypothetical protein